MTDRGAGPIIEKGVGVRVDKGHGPIKEKEKGIVNLRNYLWHVPTKEREGG